MHSEIGDLSAGIVVEPREVRKRSIPVVEYFGSRAQPLIPLEVTGGRTIWDCADLVGPFVRHVVSLGDSYVPDAAGSNKLGCLLQKLRRPALDPALNDTPGPVGSFDH